MNALFVTGTDTGVGKTAIAAALVHGLAQRGLRVAGYKPIAAGADAVDGGWINDDAEALRRASNVACAPHDVCALLLRTPCAPHLAARIDGVTISIERLVAGAHALAARAEALVIEGAGGWRVPFDDTRDSADFVQALGVPVLMVVGMRLGCLNHALLTAESIAARGLRLAGWIANHIDPDMQLPDDNVATLDHWLATRHDAPRLGRVPWMPDRSPARVAPHLDLDALHTLLTPSHAHP